jgi:hypothetical protein
MQAEDCGRRQTAETEQQCRERKCGHDRAIDFLLNGTFNPELEQP